MVRQGLTRLAERRWLVYASGLAAIPLVRTAPLPDLVRIGTVSIAVTVMVLTYVGERLQERADPQVTLLAVGIAGVAGGTALGMAGTAAGLAFVAGGILFVHRATRPGERDA